MFQSQGPGGAPSVPSAVLAYGVLLYLYDPHLARKQMVVKAKLEFAETTENTTAGLLV